jgi:hypothetical protein
VYGCQDGGQRNFHPKQPKFRGFLPGTMPPKWQNFRVFSSQKYATRNSHISVVFFTEVWNPK